jgi:DNA-3-methyladenine glycosylase
MLKARSGHPSARVTAKSAPQTLAKSPAKSMPSPAPAARIRIRRLRRSELPVDTEELARYLIGKTLVHDLAEGRLSGRIVETEAYPIGDAACHAFRGETPRNRSLFLAHGTCYTYFTYGSCWMMNVASEAHGVGGGVLIRALEPVEGVNLMAKHRGVSAGTKLTQGPGRLAAAMRINKSQDGLNLCSPKSPIWLGTPVQPTGEIGVTTRIGLSREAHRLLRFYEKGSAFVSGPRRLLV